MRLDTRQIPRPIRVALYALATLAILYLCLAPSKDVPGENLLWDKAEHAIAWCGLTALGLVLSTRRPWTIMTFAVALGAAVEVLQATMGFGRDGDWHDLLADSIGVAAAGAAYFAFRRVFGAR